MIYGDLPLADAEGARLVHRQRAGGRVLPKGHQLTADDLAALQAAGLKTITVVRLEEGDLGEDEAATWIASAAAGQGIVAKEAATGRVNLHAETAGLMLLDAERIDRINRTDEAITIATVPPYALVETGQMVATVKIIPYAAPKAAVEVCARIAEGKDEGGPLLHVAPLRAEAVGLIQTRLPDTKESVLDKTSQVTAARLQALGSRLVSERRCAHDAEEIAAAIGELKAEECGLLLIIGASAIADRRDVIPSGIEMAGGTVEHYGMPVDPGNLLLLARAADNAPILGLPGCSRSPKLNGMDWVMQRLLAGLRVTGRDIQGMGVGGLLMDIPSRPLPRAEAGRAQSQSKSPAQTPQVAGLILAAGRSSRFAGREGGPNKLLAEIDGEPMVRRVARRMLASEASPVTVVVGHQAAAVRQALAGLDVRIVENPDYAEGLSTSLRTGLGALPERADGALIMLGDMPNVSTAALNALIAAFNPLEGRAICVPTVEGKRGNPILWGRAFFDEMSKATGDVGARALISAYPEAICEVPMDDDGVLLDIDEPSALAAFMRTLEKQQSG